MERIPKLEQDVIDLQRDMSKVNLLIGRLDIAIDKMSILSTEISRLVAVQDNRIETNRERILDLTKETDKMREDFEEEHRILVKALDKLEEKLDVRLKKIERFMWIVTGGASIIGFLASSLFANIWEYLNVSKWFSH